MRMDIAPTLASLGRHKATAALLVIQIALTCAIVCNALFVVADRLDWMRTPSGIDEDRIAMLTVTDIANHDGDRARNLADLAALRELPDVEAATTANSVPFGPLSWQTSVRMSADQKEPVASIAQYMGEGVPELLGATLAEGRFFREDEYRWADDLDARRTEMIPVLLVTEPLARRLFPGRSALGQSLYLGGQACRIVGVLKGLARAGDPDRHNVQEAIVSPIRMLPIYGASYVIRAGLGRATAALREASETLRNLQPRRVITDKKTYAEVRAAYFSSDRALAGLLIGVCVTMLAVTALGIVGLASFWVGQRRRQIGVRRALGATRRDVLHYFQIENFLLAAMGIALGMVLAYGINLLLMYQYELPRLPSYYLPVGALSLWLLGQAAVLAPALRAAAVPPVEATRG